MAYDAGMLSAILWDINTFCQNGAHIEKVLMPKPDEVVLLLHAHRETKRLSISASGNAPRLTFTTVQKENPLTPPMFCMLLRKYLMSATLVSASQEGFERVARLSIASRDEMGFSANLSLIVEIMGKYSNIMLLDQSDKILGVLHVVDFTTSRLRQVLPGMTYELPPPQDKTDPRSVTKEQFLAHLQEAEPSQRADKYITSTYLGTATQVARELVFRACGHVDATIARCHPDILADVFISHFASLKAEQFTPTLVTSPTGEPLDYAYHPITYYENAAITTPMPSFSALFDAFYGAKDKAEYLRQKGADIHRLIDREITRLERKLETQRMELGEAEQAEQYRVMGDLITANMYAIKRGDTVALCTNWEAEGMPEIAVSLDPRLSPSANAQRYYKWYAKGKTAKRILTQQIEAGEKALAYLDSVASFAELAETADDLEGIRTELTRTGYLVPKNKQMGSQKKKAVKPKTFTTPSGYTLYVGANNLQNEYITFTLAEKGDLWFHVKGMPGSHVVLVCGGEEPSEADYTFAATVAAHYSRAKGKGTAVDYTRVRDLKRVPGGGPGYVIYHTNYSAYVDPDDFYVFTSEKEA